MRRPLLLFLILVGLRPSFSQTNSQDVAALQALMNSWQNEPQSWTVSTDPCTSWDGISCSNGRVTQLRLPSMNLQGTLSNSIGQLSALTYLDLSNNLNLGGSLTPNIGNLKQLTTLILLGCSFTGSIPKEIGNLSQLTFLALNSNNFTGGIPPTIGLLSKLTWLDMSANQLSGQIPVSPGLNQLVNTGHFHFSENQLTGPLSENLFNANMKLIHAIFDHNNFTGPIPASLGQVASLQIIRLDYNKFSGPVPNSIGNLSNLMELSLANNVLNGTVPDLTSLTKLDYVDLSNNNFATSPAPGWFSTLTSLNTIFMDNDDLNGTIPSAMFSLPNLQQVSLARNDFSGKLDMPGSIGSQLRVVNLTNNAIVETNATSSSSNYSLILAGNPVCLDNVTSCTLMKKQQVPYATNLGPCAAIPCPTDQSASPVTSQNCACTNPFQGSMIFRAPGFSDVTSPTMFLLLESTLVQNLSLAPGSVAVSNVVFSPGAPLVFTLTFFPISRTNFNRSEVIRISTALVNQIYDAPPNFGPYSFIASPYFLVPSNKKSSMGKAAIIGIAIGGSVLILGLVLVAVYALRQKRIAKEAVERTTNPFASWGAGGTDNGEAPQLKGARYFSFEELKKCTNNFSETHEIGSGGYGKVYKGTLANGQIAAIKRAQQGSMQGAAEFKNEIELLSRVHHKNLVSLVGFCYEQGEQLLVYEYIPYGTLRENLMGKGVNLDWKNRLRVAIGSAKGLAYLHELADPPIIHRDIKSTNILLDENLNAKVADFGLSKLVSDTQKGHVSTQVKGTLGYLDPEYYMTQQLSEKSDVYSFGVVLLELITARQPIEKGRYIVREIRTVIDQYDQEYYGLKGIIDQKIRDSAKSIGFRRFVQLAMECVEESAVDRPTMNEVVKELEIIIQNEGAQLLNSASLSAEQFGNAKRRDPYAEHLPMNDESSSSTTFDYNSVVSYSAVQPK